LSDTHRWSHVTCFDTSDIHSHAKFAVDERKDAKNMERSGSPVERLSRKNKKNEDSCEIKDVLKLLHSRDVTWLLSFAHLGTITYSSAQLSCFAALLRSLHAKTDRVDDVIITFTQNHVWRAKDTERPRLDLGDWRCAASNTLEWLFSFLHSWQKWCDDRDPISWYKQTAQFDCSDRPCNILSLLDKSIVITLIDATRKPTLKDEEQSIMTHLRYARTVLRHSLRHELSHATRERHWATPTWPQWNLRLESSHEMNAALPQHFLY